MIRTRRPLAAAACALSLSVSAAAQQQPAPAKSKTAAPSRAAVAADPLAVQRRANAVNLVTTLADESRSFHDATLRARVQAQAADALWESEPDRARALFRRAWDAADEADKENAKKREADLNAPPAPGSGGGTPASSQQVRQLAGARAALLGARMNQPNVRSEVLRAAARRDRALGEEFLAKLRDERKQDERELNAEGVANAVTSSGADAANALPPMPATINPHEALADDARRLELASNFLQENDAERALQFAEPALGRVSTEVVEFLCLLRALKADAADQHFASLVARAAADPSTDPNAVIILSSYVLTPHFYVSFNARGGMSQMMRQDSSSPFETLPPALRAGFAQFAAQELLRPLPPNDTPESLSARAAAYFVIGRLLPFIEATLPAAGAQLRAQIAAVTPDVPEQRKQGMDQNMTRGLVPESQRPDQTQDALGDAEKANTQDARDSAYMRAALSAMRKGDPKSRDYASKIDNAELRERVYAFIDFSSVNEAIRRNDGAEVLRVAQSGNLTNTQRTWAYTEAARLLKDDRAHVAEALEAAAQSARKIDDADPDRARSLVAVATAFFGYDRARAWELMPDVVKAANSAPEFTGSDAGMSSSIASRGMVQMANFPAPSFDLSGVFRSLGKEDMNRAVALAQSFTNEAPRAVATLAVARAVLEEKPASRAAKQTP